MAETQLYQNDARWKDAILGFGTDQTIGLFGCLLTSLAMVGNHFGGNETPASFNQKMKQAGGFSGPWIRSALINSVFPGVRYQKHALPEDQPAPLTEIDAALEAGSLVVVRVDYSPDPGVQGHWVVLHQKQGDDYLMWDPWKRLSGEKSLVQQFGFAGTPAEIIREVIWFGQDQLPKATPTPASAPAAETGQAEDEAVPSFTVRPNVEGLTFRRKPEIVAGNIIKHLTRTANLMVLEPADQAKAKIGKTRQWLKVRDIEGDKGYVAAWYVTPVDDPLLGVPPAQDVREATQPERLVVYVTADSLSLRSEPRVAANTLITYLPRGTELLVIRTSNAFEKIGKPGQWLQVRALDGKEGYVAGWYVTRK